MTSNTLYIKAIANVLSLERGNQHLTATIAGERNLVRLPYGTMVEHHGILMVCMCGSQYWHPLTLYEWGIVELEKLLYELKPNFDLEAFTFQQELQE